MRRRLAIPAWAAVSVAGCAYYNGMWSAERLARDAQRLETRGQDAEARVTWGRAAIKAESVLVHHGRSRWADDALVLQGEALARSGACATAARPLAQALRNVGNDALHERAALAAAECALRQGELAAAEQLVAPLLRSTDSRRRSDAAFLAGRMALGRGDPATAAEQFARSERAEAAPALIRALASAGNPARIMVLIDSVARRDRDETRWSDALNEIATHAGAGVAADVLDRLSARGRLGDGSRARLLIADGDRLRAARLSDRAARRYAQAAALVPDSVEAGRARVRVVRLHLSGATTLVDLDSSAAELSRVTVGLGGAALADARDLDLRIQAIRTDDSSDVAAFHAAELARDTLDAPRLAATLFLRFVEQHPTSLFAPKGLIAAAALRPEGSDSISLQLQTRFAGSPYTTAFSGDISPAYQVLEDSLGVALGVVRPREAGGVMVSLRVTPPRTGPRGPDLDPPVDVGVDKKVRAIPPVERRPSRVRRPNEPPTPRPEDRP